MVMRNLYLDLTESFFEVSIFSLMNSKNTGIVRTKGNYKQLKNPVSCALTVTRFVAKYDRGG